MNPLKESKEEWTYGDGGPYPSDTSKVNRVEVINHTKSGKGREYVFWEKEAEVKLAIQDEGRTLKIFISDLKEGKSETPQE